MRLATFNINGIRARLPQLLEWLAREKPDIVCLQELKAVDAAYPLYGTLAFSAGTRPAGAQVAIAPEIADRLRLKIGDAITIGSATLRVSGIIADEPDRLGQGFSLGSTALVDRAASTASGALSMPSTSPCGPTRAARSSVIVPGPHPTSSTRSPGRR